MIPLWLQARYVGMLAYRLERFKETNQHVWNFRCPLCGDSHKSKAKARGYIYEKRGDLNYSCKNCGVGTTFAKFLKDYDLRLYGEMAIEALADRQPSLPYFPPAKPAPVPVEVAWTRGLHRVSKLPAAHQARRYIESRLIPSEHWGLLFHTNTFFAWSETVAPGQYGSRSDDEPRLVIPFLDAKGDLLGYQGRSYGHSSSKYLTCSLHRGSLIFGVERVDKNELILVTEGPIDSLFLPNAIASAGGDLVSTLSSLQIPVDRFVIIYDNEPRSPTTIQKMKKAIRQGYKVCVWPQHIRHKDINDLVIAGVQSVSKIVLDNVFSGLVADLKVNQWRRD